MNSPTGMANLHAQALNGLLDFGSLSATHPSTPTPTFMPNIPRHVSNPPTLGPDTHYGPFTPLGQSQQSSNNASVFIATTAGAKRPRLDGDLGSGSDGRESSTVFTAQVGAALVPHIGPLNVPVSLTAHPGQYVDLSQIINLLASRDAAHVEACRLTQTVVSELQEKLNLYHERESALECRVNELEEQLKAATNGPSVGGGLKVRQKRDVDLEQAVQGMMKKLLDAKEERVNVEDENRRGKAKTKQILRLPHPLPPGTEKRKDEGGNDLYNPNWLVPSPLKDPSNSEFLSTVVARVRANSNLADTVTDEQLRTRAEQYFSTLVLKYRAQVDETHQKKAEAHNNSTKRGARKTAKYRNRLNALPVFADGHVIDAKTLAQIVVVEAMSSDDEGPGNVSQETWNVKANIRKENDRALETLPLAFRAPWVSRLYYALDKLAATTHNTPQFHGFKENTQTHPPKKPLPECMLSAKWKAKPENENVRTKKNPEGLDVGDLLILDDELWPHDLEYLRELEAYDADEE